MNTSHPTTTTHSTPTTSHCTPNAAAPDRAADRAAVNIAHKLSLFNDLWAQKKIADVNDYEVKLAKLKGEFVWHSHPDTDELFLVVSGRLTIRLREGDVVLGPGELFVVPRGAEHCPVADEETAILLLEPKGTPNTGDAGGPLTKAPQPLA
ncbi:cupin domain-containing protein [Streptomyces sp. NPDC017979]|uniref:cupin domain-containing protein n=1 Tax=Streptomyces sp. NPDC017979 TaxID=3365024 RepID=UPI0037AA53FB